MIETLEPRRLLSASAVELPGGIVLVRADNQGDTLNIIEQSHVPNPANPATTLHHVVQVFDQDFNLIGQVFTNVNKIIVLGGNGNDTVNVNTQDVGSYIDAGNGNDTVSITVSTDDVDVTDPDNPVFFLNPAFTGGCNTILGGNGDDTLTTVGVQNTTIDGGNGNDHINVSAVMSVAGGVFVGGANILINGSNGDDAISADRVSCSIVSGDNGNDLILVSNSTYTLILGGNGNDTIEDDNSSHDVIDGGNGHDTITVSADTCELIVHSNGGDTIIQL